MTGKRSLLEPLPGPDDPAGAFPLRAPSLAEMIRQAREFVAAAIPFGSLADAMRGTDPDDPVAEFESIMRELFDLEEQTSQAAGRLRVTPDTAATARLVLETLTWFARHRLSDPYGAAIPSRLAADTVVDALLHALVPAHYLEARP